MCWGLMSLYFRICALCPVTLARRVATFMDSASGITEHFSTLTKSKLGLCFSSLLVSCERFDWIPATGKIRCVCAWCLPWKASCASGAIWLLQKPLGQVSVWRQKEQRWSHITFKLGTFCSAVWQQSSPLCTSVVLNHIRRVHKGLKHLIISLLIAKSCGKMEGENVFEKCSRTGGDKRKLPW